MIVTLSQSLNGPYGVVRAALQRPWGEASDPHPHFCGAGKKVEPQPLSLAQTLELLAGFGVNANRFLAGPQLHQEKCFPHLSYDFLKCLSQSWKL